MHTNYHYVSLKDLPFSVSSIYDTHSFLKSIVLFILTKEQWVPGFLSLNFSIKKRAN